MLNLGGLLETDFESFLGFEIENLTAEKYQKLNPTQKFFVRMALVQKSLLNNDFDQDIFLNMLKRLNRPLTKTMIRVYKNGNLVGEFKNRTEIEREFNLSEKEVKYLLRYSKEFIKKPKYDVFNNYKMYKVNYVLKGNDYIECKIS